jgi:peptidoglycan/LPS O-acetylase OafA/YrhL
MNSHRNNFDALRLLAALTVLIFHGWPLGDWGAAPCIAGWPIYTVAVFVFFAVSGQLITQSWFRDPRLIPFLIRRAGRILPALAVVVLITTFIVGPVVSSLAPHHYFASETTWSYLLNMTLFAQYSLPGVFELNPSTAVNGSLWSLGPEVVCYLGVVVCGTIAVIAPRSWRYAPPILILIALMGGYVFTSQDASLRATNITLMACMMFLAGAVYERLNVARSAAAAATVLVALTVFSSLGLTEIARVTLLVALPYLTRYFGGASTPLLRDVGRFGDYSYGIYLWGFLALQVAVSVLPDGNPAAVLALAVPTTAVIAAASWWGVERPALATAKAWSSRRSMVRDYART